MTGLTTAPVQGAGLGSIFAVKASRGWNIYGPINSLAPTLILEEPESYDWMADRNLLHFSQDEMPPELRNRVDFVLGADGVVGYDEDEGDAVAAPDTSGVDWPSWYVPPSYARKVVHFYRMQASVMALVGPAGNGKSTTALATLMAAGWARDQITVIDGHSEITIRDLLGDYTLTTDEEGNATERWEYGVLSRALLDGKAVIIDEFDAIPAYITVALNRLFLPLGQQALALKNGEVVEPNRYLPIFLTMNTFGSGRDRMYIGRDGLDAATKDRIVIIDTDYQNEVEILRSMGARKRDAEKAVKWAHTVRQAVGEENARVVLSPRGLIRICDTIKSGYSFETAKKWCFYDALDYKTRSALAFRLDEDAIINMADDECV